MGRIVVAVCSLALLAASCGSDPQQFYTAETEANFLASCADTSTPEPLALDADAETRQTRLEEENLRSLQTEICRCTINSLEQKVGYQRFEEYDSELRADLSRPLQTAIRIELINCIKQEGAL